MINLTHEEAQQVLNDLEGEIPFYSENDCNTPEWITNAIELLRARLAQPEPKACWCETCRPITMGDMRMVLCPTCGNKRCPHATNHMNECTGSNEPGQKGSSYGGLAQPEPEQTRSEKMRDAGITRRPKGWGKDDEPEPVAYLCENAVGHKYFRWKKPTSEYKPIALYTAPPQREWVGLTDEERYLGDAKSEQEIEYAKTIEAKLKEKNNGRV